MSGIPAWAVPGRKVVCIDNGIREGGCADNLKVGAVYTIEVAVPPPVRSWGVVLVEVKSDGFLGGYKGFRFRPAVEDSDELGIETQLYRAKGRKSKAPARESERA